MRRKVTDLNKTAHKSKRKPVSKRRLQYLLHKAEVLSNQYKAERDTLIDDLSVIRTNSERYRKRAENAMEYAECSQCEVLRLERENENLTNRVRKLNLTAQTEHDELMSSDGEVRYWKNLYTTLTNHIRLKAENNPGVSRYIDLVNYIDRLERADNER